MMSNNKSIPLIFAVTGHRDLRNEDIKSLKQQVTQIFTNHQSNYPNINLVLLSALAEGADMLVAEVAQSLGIAVNVVLPYAEKAYLNSFDNEAAKIQFNDIKTNANKVIILDCNNTEKNCYQGLGEHLADNCNILIALYDGVDIGKQGGTSEVIKYMRAGNNNHFDLLDGNALYIINTPRISNPTIDNALTLTKEFLSSTEKGFNKALQKINDLNSDFLKYHTSNASNTLISNACEFFDKTANNNQSKHKKHLIWILVSSWVAFVSLEMMHVLHWEFMTFGYGIGLLIAFGVYYKFENKGKVQEDFINLRGLSEALYIQNAWNHAKLKNNVTNYHLRDEHDKFTWVKMTIKNIAYLSIQPFAQNEKHWINEQADYFNSAIKTRQAKLKKWQALEHIFYKLGLIAMFLMFIIFVAEYTHFINHGDWWLNWHYLILASGTCLISAAFIGEKYLKIKGFKEEIYDFKLMLKHFKKAQSLLETTAKGTEKYNKIIFDLGVKALKENSKWAVLHDGRKAKFSVD